MHPETAAKILDYARNLARAFPYVTTAGAAELKGRTKVARDLKAIRDKHVAAMQPAA
jgi:hypothetical protein